MTGFDDNQVFGTINDYYNQAQSNRQSMIFNYLFRLHLVLRNKQSTKR